MTSPRLLAVAFMTSATAFGAAHAVDPSAAVAEVRAAADAADAQLVEQRRTVWARLDATQKALFARNERAWLSSGRAEEEQKCLSDVPATPLAEQSCRLQVTEQRLAALSAPIVQARAVR
jgi:uncharacterized protein YecT (DUF1311 family)